MTTKFTIRDRTEMKFGELPIYSCFYFARAADLDDEGNVYKKIDNNQVTRLEDGTDSFEINSETLVVPVHVKEVIVVHVTR